MPVGHGLRDEVGADMAARTGSVLDHDRLGPDPRELRLHDARERIGAAARRERHDDVYRLRRKFLAKGSSRDEHDGASQRIPRIPHGDVAPIEVRKNLTDNLAHPCSTGGETCTLENCCPPLCSRLPRLPRRLSRKSRAGTAVPALCSRSSKTPAPDLPGPHLLAWRETPPGTFSVDINLADTLPANSATPIWAKPLSRLPGSAMPALAPRASN